MNRKYALHANETRGCIIAVASASVVSEHARGKKLAQLEKPNVRQVAELIKVSISPARQQCALLFLQAVTEH